MSKIDLLTIRAFALVLIFLLSACAEDPLGGDDQTGEGHTLTLRLSATVAPIPETKATIQPARSGSEAEKAGFYYELVSSDADTVGSGFNVKTAPPKEEYSEINFGTKAIETKAPKLLKNVYALLFTSSGAFNGRAVIGTYTVGAAADILFTNVVNLTASNSRLVIVANDNASATSYASSAGTGGFAGFSGNYADFQKLAITSAVNQDTDVPYAGSATVHLSLGEIGATASVPLYRTMAKITLNNVFGISGGPALNHIALINAGERRFATPGNDNYDGTGSTQTSAFMTSGSGNAGTTVWYAGENIRPAGTGINSTADRNSTKAPANACYIRIASASMSVANTSPTIGEEYIQSGSKAFTYNIYLGNSSILSDFSLRRHTDYSITSTVSGTLADQEALAAIDGRVTLTATRSESAGLVIGRYGGPVYNPGSTEPGTGHPFTITGSYTKLLLLEPNTSRTNITDNVLTTWGSQGSVRPGGYGYQLESRKFWDWKYIYGITANGTVGGMSTASGSVYNYCYQLTVGGVPKGSWYVPTMAQTYGIWLARAVLKEKGFDAYSEFGNDFYWTSSEEDNYYVWAFNFADGLTYNDEYTIAKSERIRVRCVRDV